MMDVPLKLVADHDHVKKYIVSNLELTLVRTVIFIGMVQQISMQISHVGRVFSSNVVTTLRI